MLSVTLSYDEPLLVGDSVLWLRRDGHGRVSVSVDAPREVPVVRGVLLADMLRREGWALDGNVATSPDGKAESLRDAVRHSDALRRWHHG